MAENTENKTLMIPLVASESSMDRLERSCTTYQDCEKLATFYILLSHAYGSEPIPSVESTREIMVSDNGGSEFLRAIHGKDAYSMWQIMDEVMDTIKAFQPRLYDATLQKIKE